MSAESNFVAPSLLQVGFTDRVLTHLTGLHMDRLGENVRGAEIISRLGTVVTEGLTNRNIDVIGYNALNVGVIPGAEETPWSAYAEIMDPIVGAESERAPSADSNLYPTNTLIRFENGLGRDRFHHFIESSLTGIPNQTRPSIRIAGPRELIAHDFLYADNATVGRIGTAFLRMQYKKSMGRNLQGIAEHTISDITEKGLRAHLPEDLAERADSQEASLGAETLLSSGNLSIVGRAMREVLLPSEREIEIAQDQGITQEELVARHLRLQRGHGRMPHIEARTRFVTSGTPIPISSTPMGTELRKQAEELYYGYKSSYQERDWGKVAQDIWSLATGLGAAEGIVAFAQAASIVVRACSTSAWGMASDRRRLRSLGLPLKG